jgi:O-antigen/teichoic acid export membrane protein
MYSQRRLAPNLLFVFTSETVTRAVSAVLLIAVSRVLGPYATGVYSIGTTLLFLGSRFSMWGLDQILIRDVASDVSRASRYFSNFLLLRVVLSCGTAVILTILVWTVLPYAPDSRWPLTILIWSLVAENIIDICRAVFIALERMHYVALISGITAVARVLGVVIALLTHAGAEGFALAVTAGGFVGAGSALLWLGAGLKLVWSQPNFTFCKAQMAEGVPFGIINLVNVLDVQVDTLVLSVLVPEAELGIYSAGLGVLLALMVLPTTFRMVFFPTIVRLYRHNQSRLKTFYQQSLRYLAILAVPVCVGVVLLAGPLVGLLYGAKFRDAAPVLQVLSGCLLLALPGDVNSRLLLASGNQRRSAAYTSLGLLTNIALNFLLVPRLGIMGAALARLASNAVTVTCNQVFVTRHLVASDWFALLWKPMLAAAVMIGLALAGSWSSPITVLVISGLAYLLILVLLRAISITDLVNWLNNPKEV